MSDREALAPRHVAPPGATWSSSGKGDRLSEESRTAAERHRELLARAQLVLIDLDGCLVFGDTPHPAAPDFLRRYRDRCAILSNNSSETPESLARLLASKGLEIDPGRILLAGSLMIDLLAAQHGDAPICLLASPVIRSYARARGLRLSRKSATIVALARDITLTYTKLVQSVACLHRGARLFVSNIDLTHPGQDWLPIPETGSILKVLDACIPDLTFTVVGKPSPMMFDIALRRFGISPASTVMIGDNPATDGAGAEAAGIASILIGPRQPHASIADLLIDQ